MRVAVVGATGYAGQQLVHWLDRHPHMRCAALVSEHEAGTLTERYFPGLDALPSRFLSLQELEGESLDLIFACQSPKQLTGAIGEWTGGGIRVVDLSADFRFADVTRYDAYYGPHPAPELLARAVTGYADDPDMQYRDALIVGNPGCYPTAFFTAVGPLVRAGLKPAGIMVDGKSGVSGAGRKPQTHLLMAEMAENVEAYSAPGQHRHTAEMEIVAGGPVVFQPHLMPMARGIFMTIYLPAPALGAQEATEIWQAFFKNSPFVTVVTQGMPRTGRVRGTNRVELSAREDVRTGTLVLYAAIDNLGKGAAGQAIQHANQWWGYPPALGLI